MPSAAFKEAQRRDPDHDRTWVVLVDGNQAQIKAIRSHARKRGVTVHIVLDFVHVLEYLGKAAWFFFEPTDPDAQHWVAKRATLVLAGKAGYVAAGIRRRATRFAYADRERKGADAAATYLANNKRYLGYGVALEAGWPIATGVIEGACRYLVKERMDITGARWGLAGGEAVLGCAHSSPTVTSTPTGSSIWSESTSGYTPADTSLYHPDDRSLQKIHTHCIWGTLENRHAKRNKTNEVEWVGLLSTQLDLVKSIFIHFGAL